MGKCSAKRVLPSTYRNFLIANSLCRMRCQDFIGGLVNCIGMVRPSASVSIVPVFCLLRAARSEIIFLVLTSRTHPCWFIDSHSSLRDPLMRVWYTGHDRMHVCFSNIARRRHDILLHHASLTSLASSTMTRAQVTSPFHYPLLPSDLHMHMRPSDNLIQCTRQHQPLLQNIAYSNGDDEKMSLLR